ncbi:tetratricopeptide repeat protein [Candidatus Poribacteria bacterium]|nr:tetratricopeptide repeat protein [Candidatus Poribacteria bacterium]MYK17127.1 tetratricopeptide repeat protein [Candidatus Poribacteria bacterium]
MKTSLCRLSITLCLCVLSGQFAIAQNAYELGATALQQDDYEEAVRHFTNAEKDERTLARLGYAYSRLGRYADAIRAYQDVRRFDTDEERSLEAEVAASQALLGLGYIAYRQGRFDEAMRYYMELVQRGTAGVVEAHHNLGRIYAERGEIENAIAEQRQAVKGNPEFADAHYHLGILYSRKQEWGAAIEVYQKAVALAPTMPNVHYQLARCYRQIGDTLAAEAAMQRFHDLKSTDVEIQRGVEAVFVADADEKAEVLLRLANVYVKHEKYEAAVRAFERVHNYSTSDIHAAQVSAGLAKIALDQGDAAQAIVRYERAVQLGLETAEIYHNLGIVYMQSRDGENALKRFHSALEINADLPESLLMLGVLYAANSDFEASETYYQQAIELSPDTAMAHHGLAYLYGQHSRNLEKAVELARHATELSPNSAPYHNTLSWLYYKVGRYKEAEMAILKAVELAPDNPLYQEGLAEIRQREK